MKTFTLDTHLHTTVLALGTLALGVLYHMHHGHACKACNQQGGDALFDGEFFCKGGKGWIEVSFLFLFLLLYFVSFSLDLIQHPMFWGSCMNDGFQCLRIYIYILFMACRRGVEGLMVWRSKSCEIVGANPLKQDEVGPRVIHSHLIVFALSFVLCRFATL